MSLLPGQRLTLQRFLRGEGPESGPVTLVQRRVFILPTRRGLLFTGLLLVMLIGAINYNTSLGYSLTFLLASLFVVAMLHTYRNLLHLCIASGRATPVFTGEHLRLPVMVENPGGSIRYAVGLRLAQQAERMGDVPAGDGMRFELPLITRRRGRHPLPRITLRTVFPLGLFRAWAHAHIAGDYLVYPRPAAVSPLPIDPAWYASLSGDRGNGADDFVGLRNYLPGDSPRRVHWKAAARGRGLFTKQFGGDHAEELWLDWEGLPPCGTEARLSLLTRWVLDADTARFSFGLRLPGTEIPLGHGAAHRLRCLEALALFPVRGEGA